MAPSEVEKMLSGPLVQWFVSCLENPDSFSNYSDLVDGVLLHRVYLQIDPEPLHDGVVATDGSVTQRVKNLEIIFRNIKQFYEEELGHLIIIEPDTMNLGKEPDSHIREARLLLLLLLGCAVQCPSKEQFVTRMTTLNYDTGLAIMECIKQVNEKSDIVITRNALENAKLSGVFERIKHVLQERDLYREKWRSIACGDMFEAEMSDKIARYNARDTLKREKNHRLAVELADLKSKLRKQRQKLDEKTEALIECKEELEHNKASIAKLKQENQELQQAARTVQSYRDELDAVNEKAERASRLELEVQKYREKLTDMDFYKNRIEELREDNRVLIENREMLEEQLVSSRRSAEKVLELQARIIDYEQLVNDMTLKRTADKERYEEIVEENCQLQRLKKSAADEAALARLISENDEPAALDSSLSEELANNAQARVLRLELENHRLMAIVDSLDENSFYETSSRHIELQREKRRLSLKLDTSNDCNENLSLNNCDLELICREALDENNKLQSIVTNQRNSLERQEKDYQLQHGKIVEMENNCNAFTRENLKIQLLMESAQKRAAELDRSLEIANKQLEKLKDELSLAKMAETECYDLEMALAKSEKERETALRDNHKYREMIEDKDVALDKMTNNVQLLERRVVQLQEEIKNLFNLVSRLREIEKLSKESSSRAAIDRETLESLESRLVAEKLKIQKFYAILEKISLNVDQLLTLSLDDILERIAQIPEVIERVKFTFVEEPKTDEKITEAEVNACVYVESITKNLQEIVDSQKKEIDSLQTRSQTSEATVEQLKSENAQLQVSVATLQSRSISRTGQLTALQLANSELVAMKEELLKDCRTKQQAYDRLINDQVTLRSLHEQLNSEYENILHERETLKETLRDAKNSDRAVRENCQLLEAKIKSLNVDKETAIANVNCLNNLRSEHSKLEDDFTNLYTTTEKFKIEFDNLQENYRRNKLELNRLSLKQTEMQGLLRAKEDKCASLKLEINKLSRSSEMLIQVNCGLESNRRSLMEHLSMLSGQYHELLRHSFDDKEHYHMEEKLYTDKVNHLYRQKEKLEEKIMDHYRNMESCSKKKKRFGSGLVKKVRQIGSELLSKNRLSWTDDAKQLENSTTSYDFELTGIGSDLSTPSVPQENRSEYV